MTETAQGHAEMVKRFRRQVKIALDYARDEKPSHEKLLPSVFELQVGHLKDIGEELAAALSNPIAAHGAGAVTEARFHLFHDAVDRVISELGGRGLLNGVDDDLYQEIGNAVVNCIGSTALRPDEAAGQGEADDRLYDTNAFMADGEVRMTAAEDVLAWLLIEKCGCVDDVNYTPKQASDIIAARLDECRKIEDATPRPAPVAPDIVERMWVHAEAINHAFCGHNVYEIVETRDELIRAIFRNWRELYDALAALRAELAAVKRERDEWRESATEFRGLCSEWQTQADTAEAEVARLKDENKELVAGLEPFANVAEWDIGDSESDEDAYRPMDPKHAVGGIIKVGDFRRARSLTAAKGG